MIKFFQQIFTYVRNCSSSWHGSAFSRATNRNRVRFAQSNYAVSLRQPLIIEQNRSLSFPQTEHPWTRSHFFRKEPVCPCSVSVLSKKLRRRCWGYQVSDDGYRIYPQVRRSPRHHVFLYLHRQPPQAVHPLCQGPQTEVEVPRVQLTLVVQGTPTPTIRSQRRSPIATRQDFGATNSQSRPRCFRMKPCLVIVVSFCPRQVWLEHLIICRSNDEN